MKKTIFIVVALLCSVAMFSSCEKDEFSNQSVINVSTTNQTPLDKWLEVNYRKPYNIDFKYRYEMNESDFDYYTIPADYDCAIIMARLVKYLCIDTYDEVAGIVFTRGYFPKMFFLMGEWEYRNNGTFILGTAEGGKKIMLSGVNYLPQYMGSAETLNYYYIKTIHHEFTHILNQTKDYPTDFKLITNQGYVADSWSTQGYSSGYLGRGFISAYSQHSDTEDFAEMLSMYITHDQTWWDEQLKGAGTTGAQAISTKLDIVKLYMTESWNVDIDQLRATILRRQKEVIDGKIDLTDISIEI